MKIGGAIALLVFAIGTTPNPAFSQAASKHPLGVDDFLALKLASDPQLSPDGKLVAFVVSVPSLTENRNVGRIWLARTDRDSVWQVTNGPGSDRAPRWSPDGQRLGYLSTRDGVTQVWDLPVRGDESSKVTSVPTGVSDFQWSRDGRDLFLVSDVKWPTQQEIERRNGEYPTDARIWTSLFYRHWNEWRVGLRQHVLRYTRATQTLADLTPIDKDVPTLALGGHDLAVAPSGTELAVTFNPDSTVATSTNNDVFLVPLDGSGPKAITTNPANDHSPAYSPDGRYIAYLAAQRPGFESDRQQLMLYEPAASRRSSLTPDWSLSVSAFVWLPDGRGLIAEVEERGQGVLYRIDVAGGKRTRLISGGRNGSAQVAGKGSPLIFLHQTATSPPEIWTANYDGKGQRALTALNRAALEQLDLTPLESFGFVGASGDSVFGWLLKPPQLDQTKSYTLLYLIHGGPQSAWVDEWHQRWNYAMFAARGYVVAAVNPHGSTGYGQPFTDAVSKNWGGAPYEDLMKGLDAVLAGRTYIDPKRLGAAGASYGGYMIYWIAGHTARFKALVAHDGVFNPLSMNGTTEELWFPNWEFGGSPLTANARNVMEKWSPANSIANWSTPMLIVHGQQDFRVDVSEGYQAFTALRLRGVPAKFLYFPDEGHFVLKPRNRRLWWGTVLDWFDSLLR
jgi:dipeptidyl aminopeptidase/acylaminoacyl peptidase